MIYLSKVAKNILRSDDMVLSKKIFCILLVLLFIGIPYLSIAKDKEESEKDVYITFDDGPTVYTEDFLDLLNQDGINATFFLIGNRISFQNSNIIKRMLNEENYIGLHTMTHSYNILYGKDSNENYFNEILKEQQIIYDLTGFKSSLIRYPYSDGTLITNEHLDFLLNLNLKVWDWNIDSEDWKAKSTVQILANIKSQVKNYRKYQPLVVLLHEKKLTLEALPEIIQFFKENNYTFLAYDPEDHVPINFYSNPNI
jgi:peptidoglycan/xylan/chitin deacetylase (PgdA/CDA1 family)